MVNQTPQRGRVTRLRIVIATSVASILLGSSFYAAQAGGGNNGGYNDSLSGLEIAAIASGAIGGGLIIAGIMRGRGNRDDDDASAAKEKTAKAGTVKEVRVRSSQNALTAGDTAIVQVEARYQGNDSWQNVTNDSQVRLVSGGLAQIDGSKNAFAVPYGSQVAAGPATIEASFGGHSATTSVSVN